MIETAEIEQAFTNWLNNPEASFDLDVLEFRPNFVDVTKRAKGLKTFVTTVALTFGRVVLLNEGHDRYHAVIERVAERLGFTTEHIPHITIVCLSIVLAETDSKKRHEDFRRHLGQWAHLFPPRHESDEGITFARAANAINRRGMMTHGLLFERGNEIKVVEYYPSAEIAVEKFLRRHSTKNLRLIEF